MTDRSLSSPMMTWTGSGVWSGLSSILSFEINGSSNFSIRHWRAPRSGLRVEFPKT